MRARRVLANLPEWEAGALSLETSLSRRSRIAAGIEPPG